MSKIALIIIGVLIAIKGVAQQDHFILIQADNEQPFYVQMGGHTLSSSGGGHLIIPQLKDSTYQITVGFPKRQFRDQDFSVTINKKDLGFQLKNLGEKGWGLFNTQTMELIAAGKKNVDTGAAEAGVKKDDAFSRMMAGVVNDTAVMYNRMGSYTDSARASNKDQAARIVDSAKKTPDSSMTRPAPDVATPAPSNSTAVVSPPPSNSTAVVSPPPVAETPFVELIAEHRTATAINLSFADHGKGHIDTVQVVIPMDTVQRKPPPPIILPPRTQTGDSTGHTARADSSTKAATGKQPAGRPKLVVVNSDCRNFATDADVTKLKAKLLSIPRDEDRILYAKKAFRLKCLTTNQVRELAGVFSNDASKFSLLEAAYPFVSDDRFRELSDLLADPFYSGKFKTMTGQ